MVEFHLPQADHGQPSNWLWPMKCRLEWRQNETAVYDTSPFSSSCHWNWRIPEGGGSISSGFPEKGCLANVNVSLCMLRGDMRREQSDYWLSKVTGCYSIIIWATLRKSLLGRRLFCCSQHKLQPTIAGLQTGSAATEREHSEPLTFSWLNVETNQKICRFTLQKFICSIVS